MLHAGWKVITVVPTDATVGTKFTKAVQAKATEGCDTPAAKYVAKYGEIGYPMWDEVASAVFMEPSIVRHADKVAMDIDIGHGANYGATVSWAPANAPGLGEPLVTVVRAIDIPRLEQMFADEVRRAPQAP
jgi:purine nucleosidase